MEQRSGYEIEGLSDYSTEELCTILTETVADLEDKEQLIAIAERNGLAGDRVAEDRRNLAALTMDRDFLITELSRREGTN